MLSMTQNVKIIMIFLKMYQNVYMSKMSGVKQKLFWSGTSSVFLIYCCIHRNSLVSSYSVILEKIRMHLPKKHLINSLTVTTMDLKL